MGHTTQRRGPAAALVEVHPSDANRAEMQGSAVRTPSQQLGDDASCLVGSRPVGKLPTHICAQTRPTGPGVGWDAASAHPSRRPVEPGLRNGSPELKRSPALDDRSAR
jgi:hypothetical protein